MNTYKATFSYDGSLYYGWQKQPDQKSIQGTIEIVLSKLAKSNNVSVIGSGRTDAGVHALTQVTKLTIPFEIEKGALKRGLNSLLPNEIRCVDLDVCSDSFQPVFDAKLKTYRYYFSNSPILNPIYYKKITHLKNKIDIEKAEEVLSTFVGEKDFVNFSTKGTPVKTTIRRVVSCELKKVENPSYLGVEEEDLFYIEIIGDGFLKQMVRLIVGAIFSYAEGKISKELIASFFEEKKTNKVAPTAPPDGLYLYHVKY